ncbi:MAG: CPBP family intramembrane glutamic endopeptidase [Fimbriimonadaceae bacterium]
MAQLPYNGASAPPRNWSGWIALAILFGLLIPATIIESFSGTDANSKDPVVQAGNLESVVSEETPTDSQTAELKSIVKAMAPSHTRSEDAAAVYAAAMVELHKPLSAADLSLLAKSKVAARRTVAELYATPPPLPDRARTLAATLPGDRFLYKLAKAQTFGRLGDRSLRRAVSPELDAAALRPKLVALTACFFVALIAGGAAIIAYLSGLAAGSVRLRGHPLEPNSLADADSLAIRAAQLFGVFLLVELTVAGVASSLPGAKTAGGSLIAEVAASLAAIVGTVLVTRLPIGARSYRLVDYGLTRAAIVPALMWGVGGLFAVVPLATVGIILGTLVERIAPRPDHPLLKLLEDPQNVPFLLGAFFLASVQAPFTEELLFRGTLTPALAGLLRGKRYAIPLAIGLSSLIFASIHPQGFTLWLPLASVGVVNCVLCYQTRSVLPGMVMHALFNVVAITYSLLLR